MESICFKCENLMTIRQTESQQERCLYGVALGEEPVLECTHFKQKKVEDKELKQQQEKALEGKGQNIPKDYTKKTGQI